MGVTDDPTSAAAAASVQGAAAAALPTGRPAPILTAVPAPVTLQLTADVGDVPPALPANPDGTAATLASGAAASVVPAAINCSSTMLACLTVHGSGTPGSGAGGHRVMPRVLVSTCKRNRAVQEHVIVQSLLCTSRQISVDTR